MEMVVTGAVTGKLVSLLCDKVLEKVQLLAEGDDRFRGLQSLLSRLRAPTDYLVNHDDKAGKTLVHQWLEDFRKELAKAEDLVTKWPKIRRWDLRGRYNALKSLIRIIENLERLDNSQTVHLASNVRNFDRLGEGVDRLGGELDRLGGGVDKLGGGVDRLGEGVDRLGEEVKISIECLTSEVRSLTEERREFARATEDTVADVRRATVSEKIEEIRGRVLGTSDSRANPEAGSGPSRSPEVVTYFNDHNSFPDEVFGGNEILDNVIATILHHDYQKCIGLWNMGGAGKTFTAGRVFHDPRIQSYFGDKRMWVTVAKRESYSIMKDIYKKVGGNEARFPAAEDVYSVRSALKGQLNLDKFLLVIDDVWETAQLDFVDLVSESEHSKRRVILVTTRLREILDRKHATKIEVSLLPENDSWKLFSRNAFGRAQVPSELRDVSRSVAAECKRLPLALKVIGSTMAGETNSQVWENSLKKLKHAMVLDKDHEIQVFGRLQLSIDNLRDRDESDSRLQHCFYYFAAYREDASIGPEELVTLWTAEGIVGKDPDSPISPESEAYELLGILIALSMIEMGRGFDNSVKIHDVMRDLVRYNLENNFGKGFSTTEKIPACQRMCLYRPGLKLRAFPKDWTSVQGADASTSTTLSVERLSFTDNELQQLPERFHAPHPRVLLLGENRTLKSLPTGFFESFTRLRVLDLQGTSIEEIPEAIFTLISLVLLNLDRCSDLRQIPATIERLQNLQQLHICSCQTLTSVPRSLRCLTSLEVLKAEGTLIWDNPESSSEDTATLQDLVFLKSLQSLSIDSSSSSPVSEIGQLIALQSVKLHCSWKEVPESFFKLVNLKSLTLHCSCSSLPALDELQHLEYLSLGCRKIESFPNSFARAGAFPSLQTFETRFTQFKGLVLQPGAMPRIKSFIIRFGSTVELTASFRVLRSLIYLRLSSCDSLDNLSAFEEPNSFPYLKELDFYGSDFRNLPAGTLQSAPNLRRIDLRRTEVSRCDIPGDLLEKERLKQLEILFSDVKRKV